MDNLDELLEEELNNHELSTKEKVSLKRLLQTKKVDDTGGFNEQVIEFKPVELNKIQGIGYELYCILKEGVSPDCFDCEDVFVESMLSYGRQAKIFGLFDSLSRRLLIEVEYKDDKKELMKELFRLAEECCGNKGSLDSVRYVLEKEYNMDVEAVELSENMILDDGGGYIEYCREVILNYIGYATKGSPKKRKLSIPEEKALDYLSNDKDILDKMIDRCSQVIYFVEDLWFMSILQCASIYAPPIMKGGRPIRSTIHILNVGDISTAKSNFASLVAGLFPKTTKADIISEKDWEGVAVKEKGGWRILPSLPERASDGLLILSEFDKQMQKREGLIRGVLDNVVIDGHKGGVAYRYKANVGVLADANPKGDFFQDNMNFRGQIKLKEGNISRMDYIKPQFLTEEVIDEIMERDTKMYAEHEEVGDLNLNDIRFILKTIRDALTGKLGNPQPKYVKLDVDEIRKLKNYLRSKKVRSNMPVIIPRTLEKVVRVVVASCCFHILQRKMGGKGELIAEEQDYENAKRYIDYQTHNLKILYEHMLREGVETLDNIIYRRIVEAGKVELKTFVSTNKECSMSTAYRVVSSLEDKGLVSKKTEGRRCYVSPVRI